jgi:hypothetical protein
MGIEPILGAYQAPVLPLTPRLHLVAEVRIVRLSVSEEEIH